MFTVKSKEEFIDGIRAIDDKLEKIRLSGIVIHKSTATIEYNFICPETVNGELLNKIIAETEKVTEPCFTDVVVNVKKIVADAQLVNKEIFDFLVRNYRSIEIFLKTTDVRSTLTGDLVQYVLRLPKDGCEYVKKNGVIEKLNAYLMGKFCVDFSGTTEEKEQEETPSLLEEDTYIGQVEKLVHRTIKVNDVEVIDDITLGDLAQYIEDVGEGEVTVCGKITDVREKETKNGKPFFIFHIDDSTGRLSGIYFTRKTTVDKIRKLQVDDCIIARGVMENANGKSSFKFEKINKCVFPSDFEKKEKYKKKVPKDYSMVFPEQIKTAKQSSVFESEFVFPEEFTSQTFVVFDLETTGTDHSNDYITEIGAVKIINGKIEQSFSTLVHPMKPISAFITGLTGISNEMVKDAPNIERVLPDFLKFIDGAVLVAHNADFDVKFIKKFAFAEDYAVPNKVMDTMEVARNYVVGLKRFGLEDLANRFNITFNHHRAVDDALATAEAFLEMMKIKYSK